jgi:hypothetical protein
MLKRDILEGIVDIHVHAGPSVTDRSFDAAEMQKAAEAAGYRAWVMKDHYMPTAMSAKLVEKYVGKGRTRILGGLCLNNSNGLFNVHTVDAAYCMGTRMMWMPTVSSQWHITQLQKFGGKGRVTVPEKPVYYVKENGELQEDLIEVLRFIAAHPEITLATGHGCVVEINALVTKAFALGVKKIIINHPYFLIKATNEEVKKWASQGAYIEMTAGCFKGVIGHDLMPMSMFRDYMNMVPLEQLVICSDIGALVKGNPVSAVEGMYRFLSMLVEEVGVTEEQINLMAKTLPAKLLAL